MVRAKVGMSQFKSELIADFDIDKVRMFFANRGIFIPYNIETKEEVEQWFKDNYGSVK